MITVLRSLAYVLFGALPFILVAFAWRTVWRYWYAVAVAAKWKPPEVGTFFSTLCTVLGIPLLIWICYVLGRWCVEGDAGWYENCTHRKPGLERLIHKKLKERSARKEKAVKQDGQLSVSADGQGRLSVCKLGCVVDYGPEKGY